tara:strand:+ start:961 stop:1467 length:507 start_codon:yes stop_codon:yes gene_type:complete
MAKQNKVPKRYLPEGLSDDDKKKQSKQLSKSKKLYKKGKYHTRKKVKSYKSKTSSHIINAKKIYNIKSIKPSKKLAKATGCKLKTLKDIVKKGKGAYYSSGSRPNQTATSWGIARLASSITGGKSSIVDFKLIKNGCNKRKKAYQMAKKTYNKKNGKLRKTAKTRLKN